jgi:hypothetical protein
VAIYQGFSLHSLTQQLTPLADGHFHWQFSTKLQTVLFLVCNCRSWYMTLAHYCHWWQVCETQVRWFQNWLFSILRFSVNERYYIKVIYFSCFHYVWMECPKIYCCQAYLWSISLATWIHFIFSPVFKIHFIISFHLCLNLQNILFFSLFVTKCHTCFSSVRCISISRLNCLFSPYRYGISKQMDIFFPHFVFKHQ